MQRKMFKLLIVGAALVASLVSVSAASAASWSTNGPVNFTATTGTTKLAASSGAALICTGPNGGTGTLAAVSGAASGAGLATVTPTFSACRVAGIAFTVTCTTPGTLDGVTWAANGGNAGNNWAGSETTGVLRSINCTLNVPGCVTTVTGTVPGRYVNPTASAAGVLTVVAAGQNLRLANGGGATCSSLRIGNGDTGAYTDGSNNNAVYTITAPAALTSQPKVWQS